MVKVSVIVPLYNAEEYLEKCIDSILAQTLEEIEIIAVDDGSTDSSSDILIRYSADFAKLKYIRKENGGAADSRNYGLKFAEGEYVGYVDSDDFVDPEMYEVMYNKAKECCCDIVECNLHHTYVNYEDTEIMKRYYTPKELLCYGRNIVWNKIYRRAWLLETKAQFPVGVIYEDVSFCSKVIPYITRYDYVDIAPVHYVQRSASVNNDSSSKTMQIIEVLRDIVNFYKENGFYEYYEHELEYLYTRILLCSSFSRMCRISDRTLRKKALDKNYQALVKAFPYWRKNPVLKKERSRYTLFMCSVNILTYKVYSRIFPIIYAANQRISHKLR